MKLYVIRHGEALSKHEARVGTDAERPLSPRGLDDVKRVAHGLKAFGVHPDRIFTSPLLRATQTADLLAHHLGGGDRAEICQALAPDREPRAFLEVLTTIHVAGAIIAVGHQPNVGRLTASLIFGEGREGMAVQPAGVCVIELPEFPRSLEAFLRGVWVPEVFAINFAKRNL